eukprot:2410255-Amphidinium_carterae.2
MQRCAQGSTSMNAAKHELLPMRIGWMAQLVARNHHANSCFWDSTMLQILVAMRHALSKSQFFAPLNVQISFGIPSCHDWLVVMNWMLRDVTRQSGSDKKWFITDFKREA